MTDAPETLTQNLAASWHAWFGLGSIVLLCAGVVSLHRALRTLWTHRDRIPFMVNRTADRPWTVHDALSIGAILAAAYALQLIVTTVTGVDETDPGGLRNALLVTQTLTMPSAGLLAIGLVLRRRKRSLLTMFGLGSRSLRDCLRLAPLGYLAALPLVLAASVVTQVLLLRLGYPVGPQLIVTFLTTHDLPSWFFIYFAFLAVAVAPVFEELMFRGIVLPVMLRSYAAPFAIALVSILFAAIHFHLPSVAPLFVIATACSLGYIWSGDIRVAILMHAIFNGVNIVLILLVSKGLLLP